MDITLYRFLKRNGMFQLTTTIITTIDYFNSLYNILIFVVALRQVDIFIINMEKKDLIYQKLEKKMWIFEDKLKIKT